MLKIKQIAKLSHLSLSTKIFLEFYNWKNCYPLQSKHLEKKISDSKVAIISSAGLVINNDQEPFDNNVKMGDSSFRIIPSDVNSNSLSEYHRSDTFDHSGIKSEPFTALPIPHILDLVKEGFIGSISDSHISIMGSIVNPSNLIDKTIPNIISILKREEVDITLLIPV